VPGEEWRSRGKRGLLGLAGTASNLWEQKIDTEWSVLVVHVALELGDLLTEHVGGVSDTSDDTDTSSVGDGGSKLWAGGNIHTGKHDGVVDLQEIGERRAQLLCRNGQHMMIEGDVVVGITYVGKPWRESVDEDEWLVCCAECNWEC
jgi:hypothetical protein